MQPVLVVVSSSRAGDPPHVAQPVQAAHLEHVTRACAAESLDECVLVGFAWLDMQQLYVQQIDAVALGPAGGGFVGGDGF